MTPPPPPESAGMCNSCTNGASSIKCLSLLSGKFTAVCMSALAARCPQYMLAHGSNSRLNHLSQDDIGEGKTLAQQALCYEEAYLLS